MPEIDTSNPFTENILFILREQHEKIREKFDMGMGWEKWAQAELGLEMERTVERLRGGGMELYPFQREVPVYGGANLRCVCDFMLEDARADVRQLHIGELKCLIKTESTADFVARLLESVREIFYGDVKEEYLIRAKATTAWVFAITVTKDLARDAEFQRKMLLEMDYIGASDWRSGVSNISPDGAIKLWAWSVTENVPGA